MDEHTENDLTPDEQRGTLLECDNCCDGIESTTAVVLQGRTMCGDCANDKALALLDSFDPVEPKLELEACEVVRDWVTRRATHVRARLKLAAGRSQG